MRIGIDIRALMDPLRSGVPEYTVNLLREIFKQDEKNQYVLFYNSFKDASKQIPEFDQANIEVIASRMPNKFFNNIGQKVLQWPKLDLLTKTDLFFMPNISFAAFSPRVRKIITVHDLSFLRMPETFSLKRRAWHYLINLKKSLKKFDQVVAVSEHTKTDIIELCGISPNKIQVIHNGIDKKYFKRADNSKPVLKKYKIEGEYIFNLGTIEPRKNILGVIQAYEILYKKHSNIPNLVIAGGKGWKYKEVFKYLATSSAKDKIKYIAYVDDADKHALYANAIMFVYPSFYEGFGFPPLEAMACACPTIVSSSSSLQEVVGGGGVLVNPYNLTEISQAMENLLFDNNLRQNLINKGKNCALKYDWKKSAQEYLELFSN